MRVDVILCHIKCQADAISLEREIKYEKLFEKEGL